MAGFSFSIPETHQRSVHADEHYLYFRREKHPPNRLGSFIGGVLRHLLSCCLNDSVVKGFPLGTLAVNLAGCFLIGILYGFFDRGTLINQELRIFLTIGLCGGFTTFSTFMNENFLMAQGAQFFTLLLYAVLSLAGGFLAVWLGYTLLKAV